MKWFLDWRKNRTNKSNKIKQWIFFRQWLRKRRLEIHKKRNFVEFLEAGDMLFRKSEIYAQIDEVSVSYPVIHLLFLSFFIISINIFI